MAEPFIGQISLYGFGFVPKYWAVCAGQTLSIVQNTALYSLLGTFYGGDGRTTFGLPDLRGVAAYGAGIGQGSPNIGTVTGTETVTLTLQQLAAHNHTLNATSTAASTTAVANALLSTTGADQHGRGYTGNKLYSTGAPTTQMASGSLSSTGGGGAHNNMQPYIALTYCIALVGIYPTRS